MIYTWSDETPENPCPALLLGGCEFSEIMQRKRLTGHSTDAIRLFSVWEASHFPAKRWAAHTECLGSNGFHKPT